MNKYKSFIRAAAVLTLIGALLSGCAVYTPAYGPRAGTWVPGHYAWNGAYIRGHWQ